VGALLVSDSERSLKGRLNAGRDCDGRLFWVRAHAENPSALWAAFRTALRTPLPIPRDVSAYDDSLLSANLLSTEVGSKSLFGFAASARR